MTISNQPQKEDLQSQQPQESTSSPLSQPSEVPSVASSRRSNISISTTRQNNSSISRSSNIARREIRRPRTSCALIPHGFYAVIPTILSIMAWIASLSQDGCDYARVTGPVVYHLTDDANIPYLEFGFNAYRRPKYDVKKDAWIVDYTSNCYDYDHVYVKDDAYWNIGKACAFVSLVLGGGGAIFLCFSSCFVFSPGTWRFAGYELVFATFFQSISFLWFMTDVCRNDSDNKCEFFFGSNSDIFAALCWFVSSVLIFSKYPSPKDKKGRSRQIVDGSAIDHERSTQHSSPPSEVYLQELELPIEGNPKATMTPLKNDPGAPPQVVTDSDVV